MPYSTKGRRAARRSTLCKSERYDKSESTVSSRCRSSYLKATSGGSVRLTPGQGRGKAAMKAARVHYREEIAKNKSRGNSNAVLSPTTHLSDRNTPLPAASTLKSKPNSPLNSARTNLSSEQTPSPAVSTPKPSPKSSTKLWTDYAARASAGPRPQSTHPFIKPRRRQMSHHPSSPHSRSGATAQRQHGGPNARRYDDWRSWVEVRVNLKGLTPDIGTYEIARSFHEEGKIGVIELFEDSSGSRTGKARITFR